MKNEKIVVKREGELLESTVVFTGQKIKEPEEKSQISATELGKIGRCMKCILGVGLENREIIFDRIIYSDKKLEGLELISALRIPRTTLDVKMMFSYYEKYPEYINFLVKMRVVNAAIVDAFKALDISNREFYSYLDSDVVEMKPLFERFDSDLVSKLKEKDLYDMGLCLFEENVDKHINYNITALKSGKYFDNGKGKHICQDCDNMDKCSKTSAPNWTVNEGKNEYLTSKSMRNYPEINTGVERMSGNVITCQYICKCKGFKQIPTGKQAEKMGNEKIELQEKAMKDRQELVKRLREEKKRLEEEKLYSSITTRGNVTIKILR